MKALWIFVAAILCLVQASPSAAESIPPQQAHFENWKAGFRARALARGFAQQQVDDLLAGLAPDPAVLERDRDQPEFTRSMADYLAGVLSAARIEAGQAAMAGNAAVLNKIAAAYHVPAHVLVAIWGLESAYGRIQGQFDVVRALATLADDGRRRAWAEGELFAILRILQSGAARRDELKGAWAGAMGQAQFLPSAYVRYAVDWDGDGRKDIWHSSADALASMAYYLARHGWRDGVPWGVEVQVPAHFDYGLAGDASMTIGGWSVLGVVRADHAIWTADEQQRPARLILPAGHKGPAFLVTDNFAVIKRYNNSTAYALGIGLLSDALGGGAPLHAAWPPSPGPLSRSQTRALQGALVQAGFDAGIADGLMGPQTRRAMRAFQSAAGLVPDGFVDRALYAPVMRKLADLANAPVAEDQKDDETHQGR